ncbi:MAG: hypothetical protein KTR29_01630 [Rhodothermaceae bacterium]|nr:hypothetical protein [Rhodothermaceae bacterium]
MQHFLTLLLFAILCSSGVKHPTDEYTYKVKNLKPRDYGIDAGTWEKALSILNRRLSNNEQDVQALYLRAVTRREMGIRKALILRKMDWKRSTEDFEQILEKDSLYHDVLYQYGLLQQYKKEFEKAFELMHRQQQLSGKKGYIEASIFRMYRYYFTEHPPADLEAWFAEHASDYATYFEAEVLRLNGDLEDADKLLGDLLKKNLDIAAQPLLLSKARIYYGLDKAEIAQSYVLQAIDTIEDEVSARLFLEDVKYILSDEEINRYTTIDQPHAYRQFFSNVLEKRNPTRADKVDLRLQVHYERLIEAESIYAQYEPRESFRVIKRTERNQTADRDFPRAYWLNGEIGDRGLIFIRHGKPDDIAASVTENTEFIESWRYLNPDLVFHFEGHSGLGVLIPSLPNNIDVLEAREIWGGGYALLSQSLRRKQSLAGTSRSRTNDLDIINYNNELFDQGIEDVGSGLTTDRYVWPGELKHINLPYMVSSFRTEDKKTRVDIHFAIPIGDAIEGADPVPERLTLDVGFAVHDTMWNALHKQLELRAITPANYHKDDSAIDLVQFIASSDSYHVNLHVGIDEVQRKGSYLFGYRVPDYTSEELMLSDIIPASRILPAEEEGRYTKNGLDIFANPGRGFDRKNPLSLYYEVYNLTYGSDDRTSYTITYTLEEQKNRKRIFRRKQNLALSLTVEREGTDRTAIEYSELDVSSVKKGAYDLKVTITDKHSGYSVTNYREIALD